MAMAAALFILLIAAPAALAADHVVGGSSGWTQSGDYVTWAAGETFTVGDTLTFTYGGSHSVDVVSKDDYDNCNTGNALTSYTGGSNTVDLKKDGPMYFICPSFGHCGGGMKLAITVSKASTTPTTPSEETPPTNETPSTPGITPATPTPPKPTPSGAAAGGVSGVVVGFSVVVATLVAYFY